MISDSKKAEPDIFSEQRQMPAQREIYFDCLRLMAAFAVIALHVAAQNWYKPELLHGMFFTFMILLSDGQYRYLS